MTSLEWVKEGEKYKKKLFLKIEIKKEHLWSWHWFMAFHLLSSAITVPQRSKHWGGYKKIIWKRNSFYKLSHIHILFYIIFEFEKSFKHVSFCVFERWTFFLKKLFFFVLTEVCISCLFFSSSWIFVPQNQFVTKPQSLSMHSKLDIK